MFLLVVIKCVKEYQGRPFIIDLTYLSKTSGSSTITTTAASTSVANAAFPDLIICSAQETQVRHILQEPYIIKSYIIRHLLFLIYFACSKFSHSRELQKG